MVSKAFSMSTLMIILGRVVCQIASYELFPGHGTKSYVDLSFANRSNKNIKIFHMESWEVIRYSIQQGIKDEDRGGGPEIFVEIKKTVLNINVSREDITWAIFTCFYIVSMPMNSNRAMKKPGVKISIVKPLVFSILHPIDSFLSEKGIVAISESMEPG